MTSHIESTVPVYYRYLLDIKEASVYYHIGEKKLREIAEIYANNGFIIMNGNRVLFKREKFQEFLDEVTVI